MTVTAFNVEVGNVNIADSTGTFTERRKLGLSPANAVEGYVVVVRSMHVGLLVCWLYSFDNINYQNDQFGFRSKYNFFFIVLFYFTNNLPNHHAHRDQHTRFCPIPLLQVPHSMGTPIHKSRQHGLCALFSICQCYRRHDGSDQYVKSLLYMLVILVV